MDIENQIEDLINKIWITKKSRINSSERLDKSESLYQMIIFWYSIVIIALSILNLNKNSIEDTTSMLLLISSIVLSFFSVFVNSKNYKERSLYMKYNYINLMKLENKLKLLKDNIQSLSYEEFQKIQLEYEDILLYVENHLEEDYIKVLKNIDKLSKLSYFKYYFIKFKNLLYTFFLFILPFFIFQLSLMIIQYKKS